MHTLGRGLRRGIAAGDATTVDAGRRTQRQGVLGLHGVVGGDETAGGKPHHMVGVTSEERGEGATLLVVGERRFGEVCAAENGLMLEVPRLQLGFLSALQGGQCVDQWAVGHVHAAVGVVGAGVVVGLVGLEAAIDMDARIDLEGGELQAAALGLGGLGGLIGAGCHIDAAAGEVVFLKVFVEVIDGALEVALGIRPRTSVVGVGARLLHIADGVGGLGKKRGRACQQQEEYIEDVSSHSSHSSGSSYSSHSSLMISQSRRHCSSCS